MNAEKLAEAILRMAEEDKGLVKSKLVDLIKDHANLPMTATEAREGVDEMISEWAMRHRSLHESMVGKMSEIVMAATQTPSERAIAEEIKELGTK